MNLVPMTASPAERLDAIFAHICSFRDPVSPVRYGTEGPIVDLSASFMQKHPEYFGLVAKEEMLVYLYQLVKTGLLIADNYQTATVKNDKGYPIQFMSQAVLSYTGMQYLHEIEHKSTLSTKCFVAMAFDKKKDERLAAVNLACVPFGFTAFTVDEHHESGNHSIDAQIILAIKGAKFCVVDFTGANQGAYMEAGYAMGRDKKVIFICEEADFDLNKKHFDVDHYPFLKYSSFADLSVRMTSQIGAYIDIEKRNA